MELSRFQTDNENTADEPTPALTSSYHLHSDYNLSVTINNQKHPDEQRYTETNQKTTTEGKLRGRTRARRQVSNVSILPQEKTGLFGTFSNLVNSIVGAGIIGIPYAISNAGLVMGIVLLILVAYLTNKSLQILVELANFHPQLQGLGVHTYEDLASIPFGKTGSKMILGGMFIIAYGAMCAYLLIIKDTVPVVLGFSEVGEGSFVETELIMVVTTLIIVLPLSMMRDMASLTFTSVLSVLADVILVGLVMFFSPINTTIQDNGGFWQVVEDNWINGRLFIGLGVLCDAMAMQHSVFIVSNSLRDPTPARWSLVTFRSIGSAAILCLMLGVAGYLGFLEETQGDILNNFDSGSLVANTGRTLLACTMLFTYPMEVLVARQVLVQLLFNGDMDGGRIGPNGEKQPLPKLFGLFGRYELVTLGIYLGTLLPALVVDDLGPILSLTGSLGASFVAYIAVGFLYLGINGDDFLLYCSEMLEGKTQGLSMEEQTADMDSIFKITPTRTGANPLGLKPWWWYAGLFPIWTSIAFHGGNGTRSFLQHFHDGELHGTDNSSLEDDNYEGEASTDELQEQPTIGPRKHDYYVSIFMIVFGFVAAVAGVGSIIYVKLNEML